MKAHETGTELIAAERQRQIEVEGWTLEHDDQHTPEQLLTAGRAYLGTAWIQLKYGGDCAEVARVHRECLPFDWPWEPEWFKPSDDPQRNMQKGGALVAAAMDRLRCGIAAAPSEQR